MKHINIPSISRMIEKLINAAQGGNIISGVTTKGDVSGNSFSKKNEHNNSPNVTARRITKAYEGIRLTSPLSVYFTVSEEHYISIEAPESLMNFIVTEVINGDKNKAGKILEISLDGNNITTSNVRINVYGPNIKLIQARGSGSTCIKGLNQDTIHVEQSGSGVVEVQGHTTNLNIKASSSGILRINTLYSENTNAILSGSGTTTLMAKKEINIKSSGSGSTIINGNPETKQIKNTGSGRISFR